MKLKNIKPTNVIIISMFVLTYPILKALTSSSRKLLVFLDSLTITSLMMLAAGVIYHLYLKGDFDSFRYVLVRNVARKDVTYDTYLANLEEKRKDSFNYPLFLGLFYLVASYIASLLLF